ncbi:SusC/RagA family TonB-linked outer membrane protein [Elizabethkingia meningoseptica]|uniref:SusC/RagA family TonB-linked outer membrane protein n=1 Tax=Elizabethkingia meningoseptica TaxID=238 RepID=UPI0023B15020|nr:TonB-dependent receptor [Elizabethkingia meningoseptica]MDE5491903.1 TonB-dependent receptor [Elizabethkingia meningoseptica]
MKQSSIRNLSLIAALYFTATLNAQQAKRDTAINEKKIEEVVLVGYGSVKKKDLTSAVSIVKSDAFENRPIYNVAQALQGNAAGVQVVQPSGKPGAALDVKIRGINSLMSSTSPLYVVDGVQTYDISGINTEDILSMSVLKDATSTAIYGVNGSGGVVIITTKRGRSNKTQVNFDAYAGVSRITNTVKILNLDQYKTLMNEINPAYVTTANDPRYAGINTNWQDEVFRTGIDQNYNVSVSGGTDKVKLYGSIGYQDMQGIIKPSAFNRLSTRFNADVELAPWIKLNTQLSYTNSKYKSTIDNQGTARGGVVMAAFNTPSFLPVYADQLKVRDVTQDGQKDGQFAINPYQSSWENPLSYLTRQDDMMVNRFMGGLGLEVKLAKGLTWKPNVTFDYSDSQNDKFIDGFRTTFGRQKKGIGSAYNTLNQNLNVENTLNYSLKTGNHDFNFLAGTAFQRIIWSEHGYEAENFPTDLRKFIYDQGKDNRREVYNKTEIRYLSFFGRVNYSYMDRYILSAVFRSSGASQLGPGNKWSYTPGVSGAWVISNEDFLKGNSTISLLKLRGGWGQTVNISGIPSYSHFALLRPDRVGPGIPNYNPSQLDNTNLTWETTTDTNIGLDLGLFNNRLNLTVDAYKRKTKDLVIPIRFPSIDLDYYANAGDIENKGIEISLNSKNFVGDNFTWSTNANISFSRNKITDIRYLPVIDLANFETVGERAVRLQTGQAIGAFYGYKVDKVDPATGQLLYKDINGDGIITPSDRTFIGNPNPKFTFGFSNNFTYKNFFLDFLFTGSVGNDIFNASRLDLELMNDFKNQSTAVLNRWTTPGQITNVPKAGDPSALTLSDRFVENGSYLRLKSATIGYNFKKIKGMDKLSLYVTGQNLFTITNYSGFDPEVNSVTNQTAVQGIDYGAYPQVRTFIFGIKAAF